MTLQQCSRCAERKPLESFSLRRALNSERQSMCKACDSARHKARTYTDEERVAKVAKHKAWRHAIKPPRVPMTPEQYREKRKATAREKARAFRAAFIGPKRPIGGCGRLPTSGAQRPPRAARPPSPPRVRKPTKAQQLAAFLAEYIGPPKPSRDRLRAVRALEKAKATAKTRRARTLFLKRLIGPPKPIAPARQPSTEVLQRHQVEQNRKATRAQVLDALRRRDLEQEQQRNATALRQLEAERSERKAQQAAAPPKAPGTAASVLALMAAPPKRPSSPIVAYLAPPPKHLKHQSP